MSVTENLNKKEIGSMVQDFWDSEFFDELNEPKKAVNVIERDTKFKIEVLAPGFRKKDFSINAENGVLNILAEHEAGDEENYLRREFSRSSFCGAFSLPENVSPEHIRGKYKDGILSLTLRKTGKLSSVKKHVKIF
ncbi:Hsp20/alpha crystallin family protein [Pedobacter sp. G11]|uniref:Hsp20/alpha crystallin family protein n=1 Tax=Pedobacter sp. G11 TaxID=2482728 RepID=UPI000F5DC2F6|nr:Hsp20/alpha crystallin family protein [Pedobacter sp. G11]AZI26734.1 Hsp20/alpha crystallin family protein [Pedobacter sp. G11]